MSIYTKKGDHGLTSLLDTKQVSKSDERIELVGVIDELTSHLGLIKASHPNKEIKDVINQIQGNLKTIMASVADQYNRNYKLKEDNISQIQDEIDRIEQLYPALKEFVLPGSNALSAQIDVARTVARRVERTMVGVAKRFTVDKIARIYINRLSDYLYVTARYTDYLFASNDEAANNDNIHNNYLLKANNKGEHNMQNSKDTNQDDIINAVINRIGAKSNKISLESAKSLIDKIEEYSKAKGLNSVIAVCNPEGNPVAVHAMDNAFLASFEVALSKAYTSVAVKMSTEELGKLALPGETFYGIDKADKGRISIIGGGVPLKVDGQIIGGLGVSGGTAAEDIDIANYGLKVLEEML